MMRCLLDKPRHIELFTSLEGMAMKAYVMTSGAIFALLVIAHLWRAAVEGARMYTDPAFIIVSIVAVAMTAWAWRVLRITRS